MCNNHGFMCNNQEPSGTTSSSNNHGLHIMNIMMKELVSSGLQARCHQWWWCFLKAVFCWFTVNINVSCQEGDLGPGGLIRDLKPGPVSRPQTWAASCCDPAVALTWDQAPVTDHRWHLEMRAAEIPNKASNCWNDCGSEASGAWRRCESSCHSASRPQVLAAAWGGAAAPSLKARPRGWPLISFRLSTNESCSAHSGLREESLSAAAATLVWAQWHYLLAAFNDFPPRGAAVRLALRIALDTRLSGHYTHCNMQLTLLLHFHYTIIH